MRLLAEGGMGQVYEARHVTLGRRAALKMVRPDLAREEGVAERFFTEAQAMSLVEHPSLVHVYEYGELDDGGAYIVMEFVEGQTLRELVEKRGGKLPSAYALVVARQIAMALHSAHSKGIVHRDLKPENIIIVDSDESSVESRVKIFDFGIAKVVNPEQAAQRVQTRPGQIIGTPTYMAPEQAGAPGGVGPHTDVYALGVMLFEMVSGQPPFVADDGIQLVGKHIFVEPPRLGTIVSDVDGELEELVHRMLAKKGEDRPSMRDVKAKLGQLIRQVPLQAERPKKQQDEYSEGETFVLSPSKPPVATVRAPALPSRLAGGILDRIGPLQRGIRARFQTAYLVAGLLCIGIIAFSAKWALRASKPAFVGAAKSNVSMDQQGKSHQLSGAREPAEGAPTNAVTSPATELPNVRVSAAPGVGKPSANAPNTEAAPGTRSATSIRPPSGMETLFSMSAAEKAYQERFFERAAFIAERHKNSEPLAAWELIGRAACGLRNPARASVAYSRVKAAPVRAQALIHACNKHGFLFSNGVFQPK